MPLERRARPEKSKSGQQHPEREATLDGAKRCDERSWCAQWSSERVGEPRPPGVIHDERAGFEPAQLQRGQIERPASLGVGGVEQLEAPVDDEAVHLIARHASAGTIGCLEHDGLVAVANHDLRAAQTREAAADDQHLRAA